MAPGRQVLTPQEELVDEAATHAHQPAPEICQGPGQPGEALLLPRSMPIPGSMPPWGTPACREGLGYRLSPGPKQTPGAPAYARGLAVPRSVGQVERLATRKPGHLSPRLLASGRRRLGLCQSDC